MNKIVQFLEDNILKPLHMDENTQQPVSAEETLAPTVPDGSIDGEPTEPAAPVEEKAAEEEQRVEDTQAGEDRSAFNCPDCAGEGLKDQYTLCPRCSGTGKV